MSIGPEIADQIAELVGLGRTFLDNGQLDQAESLFLGLRDVAPDNFEINKQLGIVLATKGAFAAARDPLTAAAGLDGRDPIVFNVLSACAFEIADYPAALAAADCALTLRPAYPEAHNNRGNALLRLDRPSEAAEALKAALKFMPRDAELHLNLCNALEALDQLPAALDSIERALALEPRLAPAQVNRGNILQKLGRHSDALQAYDQALVLNPRSVDANWNRAVCQLLIGDFEAGWAGYEWRWRRPVREAQARDLGAPLWLGQESLEGRTLLLHGEQGLGDTIQFVRYLPKVAARGARIVLEVFAPIAPLMASLSGDYQIIRRGDPLPSFDLQCPLMSLPLALGEPQPMQQPEPYLKTDPERVRLWAERLGPRRDLRVGLVCSGSATHGKDAERSIPFEVLSAHLPLGPDYHFLQKDVREGDRAALAARPDLTVWAETLGDFSDTAALVEHMDVVVSVDTSVAHLAGAVGRPVWVLIPIDPDWRWGLQAETTPWYPRMKLYRQTARRDWTAPLDRIAADLLALAGA